MQLDSLIRHLQNNHSLCWSDVYWIKDDPTIILQEPTLCHSPQSRINTFKKFLGTICHLPTGQGIVTLNRTSQNEAFNRVKLMYLDKKIDYWQLYAARHALAVVYYNEGYTYLLSEIQEIYCGKPFELEDTLNICMIESSRSAQQQLNVEKIHQHNQMRAEKYANERRELAGFDFSQVIKI